jgi:hypothetical protein
MADMTGADSPFPDDQEPVGAVPTFVPVAWTADYSAWARAVIAGDKSVGVLHGDLLPGGFGVAFFVGITGAVGAFIVFFLLSSATALLSR